MRKRSSQQNSAESLKEKVSARLEQNEKILRQIIKESLDIVYYGFKTPDGSELLLVYMDDIINKEILDRDVAGALISGTLYSEKQNMTLERAKSLMHFTGVKQSADFSQIVPKLLSGDVVIFIKGQGEALLLPSQGWQQRGIIEPEAEIITKGPREGFVETLKTNRAMVRRKLQNPNLIFEPLTLGSESCTAVNLAYIDGIVNEQILAELKKRLGGIDIDALLDATYIEELIRDEQFSPFNTVGYTERPDVVAAKILEGRIALMLDGSPVALTVPFLFLENLQANEDYYTNYFAASLNRVLRFLSFLLTVFVPGLYVALITNHHEIIPQKLLFSMIAARSGVPFPTIIEVLVMIVLFELLRESGLRLPKGLGQTVSIVGALVLGQAAVEAKIISAPVVIVIAITAITSFIFYHLNGAIILSRFLITILGALFGLYGVTLGLIAIFIHMYSLQSFGIAYMSYIASMKGQELKDTVVRAPWWYMHLRPKLISGRNYIRKGRVQKQ